MVLKKFYHSFLYRLYRDLKKTVVMNFLFYVSVTEQGSWSSGSLRRGRGGGESIKLASHMG